MTKTSVQLFSERESLNMVVLLSASGELQYVAEEVHHDDVCLGEGKQPGNRDLSGNVKVLHVER